MMRKWKSIQSSSFFINHICNYHLKFFSLPQSYAACLLLQFHLNILYFIRDDISPQIVFSSLPSWR